MEAPESSPLGEIGIFGGTFDPIHIGHLLIAELVAEQLGLEALVFVPNRFPPHPKAGPVTEAEHRLEMTAIAVAGNPRFRVSRIELDRPAPSYSIDTIRALRAASAGSPRPYFLLGGDELATLGQWRAPDAVLAESRVVGVCRPGFDERTVIEALGARRAERVTLVRVPLIEVSATQVRQRVRTGRSIRYMVPGPVVEYIQAHGLYRGGLT